MICPGGLQSGIWTDNQHTWKASRKVCVGGGGAGSGTTGHTFQKRQHGLLGGYGPVGLVQGRVKHEPQSSSLCHVARGNWLVIQSWFSLF